jgi:hypothetical protein
MPRWSRPVRQSLLVLLLPLLLAACGTQDEDAPARTAQEHNDFAERFTETLGRRDYAAAHAMLGDAYAATVDAAQLQSQFEALVPPDATGLEATAIGEPLTEWPARAAGETAIVYVTIEGSGLEEFEALSLTLGEEAEQQKVFGIEFGRAD